MQVILKFFKNEKQPNLKVLSRTLLKVAVVSKNVYDSPSHVPNDGEFWLCRVIKETKPGVAGGCFVVEPSQKIDPNEILKLYPGSYDYEVLNGRIIVKPKKFANWILPLEHKRLLAERNKSYCVIVDLEYPIEPDQLPERVAPGPVTKEDNGDDN